MKIRKRMVVMGLTVMALMLLSMSLSMARSFPINPLFLAPGIREQGAYTMGIPGTYGHLIALPRVPWNELLNPTRTGKDEVNNNAAGVLMKANKGKRYTPGQWPTAPPYVFKYDPSPVFTSDTPYTGPGVPTHEQDGHHHPPAEKCMSCTSPGYTPPGPA